MMIGNNLPGALIAIGPMILFVFVILLYGFLIALVIIGLIRLVRYLGRAGQERQRLRLELSKLADEMQRLREDLRKKEEGDKSGAKN